MNVGNIGNAYGAYNYTNKVQNNSGKSFVNLSIHLV